MPKWKRAIYALPPLAPYRAMRTAQLAARHRPHPLGFLFAGKADYFDERWEPEERAVIAAQLATCDVFIDVGSHQGIYTCMAASRGLPTAAVEPEAGHLRFLRSNVQANGFDNVEIFPVAVAASPGAARFYGDGNVASLLKGWHGGRRSFSRVVPVNSLDNLFADRWPDRQLLIKVDVEGAEVEAVKGATRLLSRSRKPVWIIESFLLGRDARRSPNTRFPELFETMFGQGYACMLIETGTPVTMADVERWSADPAAAGLGSSNFLFHG